MAFPVTVEWSSRSKALQARLAHKAAGVSFWLLPPVAPVAFGIVAPQDVASWPTATTLPLPVVTDIAKQTATVSLANDLSYVRLDFALVAGAKGHTSTILSFRQLFLTSPISIGGVPPNGTLLPAQYANEDVEMVATPNGPVRGRPGVTGFKTNLGLHPLLSLTGVSTFAVNTEFVDVTELWWKVHPDTTWGWYRHPGLKGRQEHLRVLAWTHGGDPMIWFAAVPDAAVSSRAAASAPETKAADGKASPASAGTPADIVFIRPPPGSNAFPYEPTQAGFEQPKHDDVTLVNLARYLLSPVPENVYLALQSAGLRSAELLADQVQPKATTPSVKPADPMSLMRLFKDATMQVVRPEAFTDGRANAFRPVGLEAAVNRMQVPHVLFLPLGFTASAGDAKLKIKAHPGGYHALNQPSLKRTIQSALALLWTVNAVSRDQALPPQTASRELWLAGHSEGNRTVWSTLEKNGKDVDRVISFDSDTLSEGIKQLGSAGKQRPPSKPIHAFVVMTPTNGGAAGMTDKQDQDLRALRNNNVLVTELPDFPARADYWHLNPPPIKNAFIHYLLAKWKVPAGAGATRTLLDTSATNPGNWGFLFFHEMAVFGGELVHQTGAPRVRTFFEMALGPPNPRP